MLISAAIFLALLPVALLPIVVWLYFQQEKPVGYWSPAIVITTGHEDTEVKDDYNMNTVYYPNIPTIEVPLTDDVTNQPTGETIKVVDWAEVNRRCKLVQDLIDGNTSS